MLTRVLIDAVLKIALILIPAVVVVVAFALGTEHAFGALVGAILALASSLGLVWAVGQLLDPRAQTSKAVLLAFLFSKLFIVGGLLWLCLSVWGVSPLGLVIGIGAAVAALVAGVNRGSTSPEGRRAMDQAEAEIAEEMGKDSEDKDNESS